MLRRVTRAAIFVSLALALWTLACPASAMPAGVCDDRGASAIAPVPALEPPESAIERTRAARAAAVAAACDGDQAPSRITISPARRQSAGSAAYVDGAVPTDGVRLAPATRKAFDPASAVPPCTSGAKLRIERPPRA